METSERLIGNIKPIGNIPPKSETLAKLIGNISVLETSERLIGNSQPASETLDTGGILNF